MAMGGKVAEELTFGAENVTSGASSDIQQVTNIARAMVTQFGMSDKLGNINYSTEQQTYLGAQGNGTSASPDMQAIIDEEVRKLVDEGYATAVSILTKKKRDLKRLAEGLLEYETLTGDEIKKVIAGKPLNRGQDDDEEDNNGSAPSVTAVPKTKKKPKAKPSGGLKPEPT